MTVTAPVFDIQRFSLHDGPGIRSLVFLKGCTLHCPWCQNPESQDHQPVVAFHQDRCTESFECISVCEEGAIRRTGFRVDQEKCTVCARCVEACASGALRLIGEECTPEQLMEKVRADAAYYASSGGGVTFTGGEPTRHIQFLDRVLDMCIQESIHTNLETSGIFSFERSSQVLSKFDLIYFDLKILDPARHRQHLGGGYELIEKNARALVGMGLPVEFRMPVIPGFTDGEGNIECVADLLLDLGQTGIHLLAYHNMGEAKIDIIQGRQPYLGLDRLSDERLAEVEAGFRHRGIEIVNSCQ
jgi:pyruvate formate lyase activating enzyme